MTQHLIGKSPSFEALMRSAGIVARTDVTVLIAGETGTGKEVLANVLQSLSGRTTQPFVTLNCAALPESIAESELFGHRRGAFTGAVNNQIGKLEAADGGTLFLDEIDSLGLPIQAKLLRFLETGECQPVGEVGKRRVNVRIIAATNADLPGKIARGEFRKDLYYRLNVVPLEIPPLRERSGDIELLLNHFMQRFANEHGTELSTFGKSALLRLRSYSWPGNVRELRNLCERLSILLPGRVIEADNLPFELNETSQRESATFTLPESGINLEAIEVEFIRQALSRTGGNRTRSARLLGISRDTLLYRMQKYGLQ